MLFSSANQTADCAYAELVTTTAPAPASLRRAVVLMTFSGFLVPAVGLITAPILARALSVDGRGEFAAALAPSYLILGVATLGLPDALTYYLAKKPSMTRTAIAVSSTITLALGSLCFLITYLTLPFLSGGDDRLGQLILLATGITVPALVVNVLRGAAMGHQMWMTVVVERIVTTIPRMLAFIVLFAFDQLTVVLAIALTSASALVSTVVYVPMLLRSARRDGYVGDQAAPNPDDGPFDDRVTRLLVSFGSKVWLGSVASMLLSRASQLLMVPLSSVQDLGLYSVATTVSDVPLVVALAIQGALFGVNSKTPNPDQLTATARLTLLVAVAGCLVLGGSLPWTLAPLFGQEFMDALVPTVMLLVSALLCIPGLMAATALTAWGRPALRSIGLVVGLVVNIGTFVVLVPLYGVYGAAWASVATNVAMSTFMVVAASRLIDVKGRDFWLLRGSDIRRGVDEMTRLVGRFRPS